MKLLGFLLVSIFLSGTVFIPSDAVRLIARLSRNGIKGNVTFEQSGPGEEVVVKVNIENTAKGNENQDLQWGIYTNPVDYSSKDPCRNIADQVLVDLTKKAANVFSKPEFRISPKDEPHIEIIGPTGTIWGRALRIKGSSVDVCATLQVDGPEKSRTVRARFRYPIGGSVWFRTIDFGSTHSGINYTHTLIFSDLYDVSRSDASRKYPWLLYASEARFDDGNDDCKSVLNNIYDPDGRSEIGNCEKDRPQGCRMGELGMRHGELEIGSAHARFTRKQFVDTYLTLPELGSRVLHLVLKDPENLDKLYACARLSPSPSRRVQGRMSSSGVSGFFVVEAESPFEPTKLSMTLNGLNLTAGGFHVHEFPVPPPQGKASKTCAETGGHFNPFKVDVTKSPGPGLGTHDEYEVGDLSGKHGFLTGIVFINGSAWDTMLPLWGPRTISGRSIVIHKGDKSRWVCTNLKDERPMIRAVVKFNFPFVGTMEFRQAENDPDSETSIFIESLIYDDGTGTNSTDHMWHIHEKVPERQDSINWEKRCTTAGGHFNPFKVDVKGTLYEQCSAESPEYCEVGDLAKRLGPLKIEYQKERRTATRFFFSDTYLPLSGHLSVIGKSVVVHADNHPNRGNRLACTKVVKAFRSKGVVSRWFTDDSDKKIIAGSIEFTQDSPYDETAMRLKLDGLMGIAGGYHVHELPVETENQFPCQTTGGHWNPFDVSPVFGPRSDMTDDQFEVGDLNRKHGNLDGMRDSRGSFNDSNLPLYGNTTILGRSVVVHKMDKGARWSCGTIGIGFSPSEATQKTAMASFHHPNGFARGYVRFTQIIYNSGFESETLIEINLKHSGENTRNKATLGHNWAVNVGQVGDDATVKFASSRCTAAVNRWNLYNVELQNMQKRDLYNAQCGQDLPARCEVGDMSGKLGPISIGLKKVILSDPNFPMTGKDNGMTGKSVVIFDENGSADRFACAAIEPYDDIVQAVTVQKPPSFTTSQFMREARDLLGAPEWMTYLDMGETKELHGGVCIRLVIHFTGSRAQQLQQDFTRMLDTGTLASPTISVPGIAPEPKRTFGYKRCKQEGGDAAKLANKATNFQANAVLLSCIMLTTTTILRNWF